MSLISGFSDSSNIKLVDGLPHFHYTGKSYLERLKNGLSLDLVFAMEESTVAENSDLEVEEDYKQPLPNNHELYDEEYEREALPMPRKGKKIYRKRSTSRNYKKNNLKKNGNDDKQHIVNVNLAPECNDEWINSDYDYDYDYDSGEVDDNSGFYYNDGYYEAIVNGNMIVYAPVEEDW